MTRISSARLTTICPGMERPTRLQSVALRACAARLHFTMQIEVRALLLGPALEPNSEDRLVAEFL
jgi:hypothetical protein